MKQMIMAVAAAMLAAVSTALLAQDGTPSARYYYPYPYYAPYYVAPGWGLSVCAGRAFRHGFGSFCI